MSENQKKAFSLQFIFLRDDKYYTHVNQHISFVGDPWLSKHYIYLPFLQYHFYYCKHQKKQHLQK